GVTTRSHLRISDLLEQCGELRTDWRERVVQRHVPLHGIEREVRGQEAFFLTAELQREPGERLPPRARLEHRPALLRAVRLEERHCRWKRGNGGGHGSTLLCGECDIDDVLHGISLF